MKTPSPLHLVCFLHPYLLLSTFVLGQEVPSIGFITPDIVGEIGQDVKLECVIQNGEDYPVNWMKLNDRSSDDLISTGTTLAIKDPRFSLMSQDGTYTLTIRDLKESDASKYQCQVAVSLSNKKTADVAIQLKLPPVISKDTPVNIQAVEGENVDLLCESSGFPSPKITWRRSDGSLFRNGNTEMTGNILTLSNTLKVDRGTYICTASNGVGKDVNHSTFLEIGFSPDIGVDRPRISQAIGYDVELACKISAFPTPSITWHRIINETTEERVNINDEESNYEVNHFAEGNQEITTKLKIFAVQDDQYGLYFCKAANKFGSDKETMELYESALPICPPVCNSYEMMFLSSGSSKPSSPCSLSTLLFISLSMLLRK
eukprot:TRINITY_DN664_c0_g1_i10.p1 TRINITY_DN664_c0_g1~~TRINITY_DN664_c0_g1_i10.p1  ORF type:complete len:374 (+),score=72.54 TRINITY_DN664_c0_g1_i10:1773-2894(+)